MFHRRNQSGRSSIATDPDWPPAAGEKHSNKGEDGSHVDSPPPSYLPDPSATSGRSANTWSMWVGRLAPGRPPSPSASTTTSSLAPNDPRISIIAPSPVSSRAALMANSSQHSRASSALSSNHLHPLYIHNRNHQRPLSTKSRESLATVKDTSGESSPVLSELTKRFPMPHLSESNAGKAQDHSGSTKTLASNNPYRTSSLTAGYTRDPVSANQRYSYNTIHSNEGERNPFEFETESGAFDVDFSQIGVTPAHSGHSTLNPTTPITPVARRKSASSLSLYSEEGHIRSLNPFLTDDKAPHKSVFQQAMPPTANNQIIETFGTAKIEHRPWSPLELSSTDISRKPSFVSSRSGQDFAAWEEEFGDHGTHTPKTFSKLVDMYAGRAM